MLYKNYQTKIEKIAKAVDFVKRHKVPILSVIGAVLALFIAFLSVRGIITKPLQLSVSEVVYGGEYNCNAGALFRGVGYEFSAKGEEEWEDGLPEKVGEYSVRAYAKRTFGKKNYTDPVDLTISPKKIDVEVTSRTISYGERPEIQCALEYGDKMTEYQFDMPKKTGNFPVCVDEDSVIITNTLGEDVTNCYDINCNTRNLTVSKKSITLNVEGETKVYDATPLKCEDYTCDTLAFADTLDIKFETSLIDTGSIKNTPTFCILNENNEDVTNYYTIKKQIGDLVVTPRPATVSAKPVTAIYDAQKHQCNDFSVEGLVDGHFIELETIEYFGELIVVGKIENAKVKSVVIKDLSEVDVTQNYTITFPETTVEVTKRYLSIIVTDSKTYNDQILELSTLTNTNIILGGKDGVQESGIIFGHDVIVQTSDVNALSYSGDNVVVKISEGNVSVTENYDIDTSNVNLTIDKRPITFTANSNSKIYDSTALTDDGYLTSGIVDVLESGLIDGHTPDITVTGSITDVKDNIENNNVLNLNRIIKSVDGKEIPVTDNYLATCVNGTLKIIARDVNVWANINKDYDDTSDFTEQDLSVNVFKIENDLSSTEGLYEGQSVTLTCSIDAGTSTNAGTYIKVVAITNLSLNGGQEGNYNFSRLKGDLNIAKRLLTIYTQSGSRVYNGEEQDYQFIDKEDGLVAWHEITYTDWAKLKNVLDGEIENTTSVYKITDTRDNFDGERDNYEISIIGGTFKIDPRNISLSYENSTTYTDEPFRIFGADVSYVNSEHGIVSGQQIDIRTSDVDWGTYSGEQDKIIWQIYWIGGNSEDCSPNYNVNLDQVKLTINKRDITITAKDKTITYNGEYYSTTNNSSVDIVNLVSGHFADLTVKGLYKDTRQNNKTYVVEETCKIRRSYDSVPVEHNYNITYVSGTLTVNKLDISVEINYDKIYDDNKEFTDKHRTLIIVGDGINSYNLFDNQILQINSTVNISSSDANTYSNSISVADGNWSVTKNGSSSEDGYEYKNNYNVTFDYGLVKIYKRDIAFKTGSAEKTYDREKLEKDEITVVSGSYAEGHEAVAKGNLPFALKVNEGSPETNDIQFNIVNANGVDKTYNYNFTAQTEYGTLTIKYVNISIMISSYQTIYDGNAHSFDGMVYKLRSSLLSGDSLQGLTDYYVENEVGYRYTGSVTNVGNYKVYATPVFSSSDANYTDNVGGYYKVTFVQNNFTISYKDITVTSKSITKTEPITRLDTENSATSTELVGGDQITIVVTGSNTNQGMTLDNTIELITIQSTVSGTLHLSVAGQDGEYILGNYRITVRQGKLTYN